MQINCGLGPRIKHIYACDWSILKINIIIFKFFDEGQMEKKTVSDLGSNALKKINDRILESQLKKMSTSSFLTPN